MPLNVDVSIAWIYYLLLALLVGVLLWRWPVIHVKEIVSSSRHIWRIVQISVAILLVMGTGVERLITQPNGLLTVTFLSVGPAGQPAQGEAILVRTPDGKTMLIDGGMDVASLSQALDSQLPPWQRSLDIVLLTCPRQDHLAGLVDIVTRYTIGEVIDAGMLHPNTTYARWQRTINERNFQYTQVIQGDTIALGTTTELRVLWPTSQLHSGSNEVRDNGLIIQLIAPDLRMLLLGASAQSDYALAGLAASTDTSVLQSNIVQIVGEVGKPIPQMLVDLLQRMQPSLLIITPAVLNAAQRKAGLSSISDFTSLQSGTLAAVQIKQTAQVGTLEIASHDHAWSVNLTGVEQTDSP